MNAGEKAQLKRDIEEAFSFAGFIVHHPSALKKLKNGARINIRPRKAFRLFRAQNLSGRIQTFASETIFRSI